MSDLLAMSGAAYDAQSLEALKRMQHGIPKAI